MAELIFYVEGHTAQIVDLLFSAHLGYGYTSRAGAILVYASTSSAAPSPRRWGSEGPSKTPLIAARGHRRRRLSHVNMRFDSPYTDFIFLNFIPSLQ